MGSREHKNKHNVILTKTVRLVLNEWLLALDRNQANHDNDLKKDIEFEKSTFSEILDSKFISNIKANKLQEIVDEKIKLLSLSLHIYRFTTGSQKHQSLRSQPYYHFLEAEIVNRFLEKHYSLEQSQTSEGRKK